MTAPASSDDLRAFEVRSDESLEILVGELLIDAFTTRMWLLFLDDRGRLMDPLLPIDELPDDAAERVHDRRAGDVSHAELVTRRAHEIAGWLRAASFAVVWERPGRGGVTEPLRAWIDGVAATAERIGAPLRAQVVLSNRGARVVGDA